MTLWKKIALGTSNNLSPTKTDLPKIRHAPLQPGTGTDPFCFLNFPHAQSGTLMSHEHRLYVSLLVIFYKNCKHTMLCNSVI